MLNETVSLSEKFHQHVLITDKTGTFVQTAIAETGLDVTTTSAFKIWNK